MKAKDKEASCLYNPSTSTSSSAILTPIVLVVVSHAFTIRTLCGICATTSATVHHHGGTKGARFDSFSGLRHRGIYTVLAAGSSLPHSYSLTSDESLPVGPGCKVYGNNNSRSRDYQKRNYTTESLCNGYYTSNPCIPQPIWYMNRLSVPVVDAL